MPRSSTRHKREIQGHDSAGETAPEHGEKPNDQWPWDGIGVPGWEYDLTDPGNWDLAGWNTDHRESEATVASGESVDHLAVNQPGWVGARHVTNYALNFDAWTYGGVSSGTQQPDSSYLLEGLDRGSDIVQPKLQVYTGSSIAGKPCVFSVDLKATPGNEGKRVGVRLKRAAGGDPALTAISPTLTGEWVRFAVIVAGLSDNTGLLAFIETHAGDLITECYAKNPQIEVSESVPNDFIPYETSAVYATTNGNTVDENDVVIPGTGTALTVDGLQLEGARTNQLDSTDITTWAINGSPTVDTADGMLGPDGAVAVRIDAPLGTVNHVRDGVITLSAGDDASFFVYVKQRTSTHAGIRLYAGASDDMVFVLNFTTGQAEEIPAALNVTVENGPDGWFKVSASYTQTTGHAAANLRLGGAVNYATDAYYALPQVEAAPFPSSFIPSTIAASTRVATKMIREFSTIPQLPDAGLVNDLTVHLIVRPEGTGIDVDFLSLDSDLSTDRMRLYSVGKADYGLRWIAGGVSSGINSGVAIKAGTLADIRARVSEGDLWLSVNGSAPVTMLGLGSMAVPLTWVRINQQHTTTNNGFGIYKHIAIYPSALTDEEITALPGVWEGQPEITGSAIVGNIVTAVQGTLAGTTKLDTITYKWPDNSTGDTWTIPEDTTEVWCDATVTDLGGNTYGPFRSEYLMVAGSFIHSFTESTDLTDWNADHRASYATGVDSSGNVFEVIDHQPVFIGGDTTVDAGVPTYSGVTQGLQIEGARTNRLPETDIMGAGWNDVAGQTREYSNTIPAPDGSMTAVDVTVTDMANANITYTSYAVDPTTDHISIWARALPGESGTCAILNANTAERLYNLTDEWQRFDQEQLHGDHFYAFDGRQQNQTLTRFLLWGPQAEGPGNSENASYLTSFIPSSFAAATRAETWLYRLTETMPELPDEGMTQFHGQLIFEAVAPFTAPRTNSKYLTADNAEANTADRMYIQRNSSGTGISFNANSSLGTEISLVAEPSEVGELVELRFSIGPDGVIGWVNGNSTVQTATWNGAFGRPLNTWRLGTQIGGHYPLPMLLKHFVLKDGGVPLEELEALPSISSGEVAVIGTGEPGSVLYAGGDFTLVYGTGTSTYKWYADGQEVATGGSYTIPPDQPATSYTVEQVINTGTTEYMSISDPLVSSAPLPATQRSQMSTFNLLLEDNFEHDTDFLTSPGGIIEFWRDLGTGGTPGTVEYSTDRSASGNKSLLMDLTFAAKNDKYAVGFDSHPDYIPIAYDWPAYIEVKVYLELVDDTDIVSILTSSRDEVDRSFTDASQVIADPFVTGEWITMRYDIARNAHKYTREDSYLNPGNAVEAGGANHNDSGGYNRWFGFQITAGDAGHRVKVYIDDFKIVAKSADYSTYIAAIQADWAAYETRVQADVARWNSEIQAHNSTDSYWATAKVEAQTLADTIAGQAYPDWYQYRDIRHIWLATKTIVETDAPMTLHYRSLSSYDRVTTGDWPPVDMPTKALNRDIAANTCVSVPFIIAARTALTNVTVTATGGTDVIIDEPYWVQGYYQAGMVPGVPDRPRLTVLMGDVGYADELLVRDKSWIVNDRDAKTSVLHMDNGPTYNLHTSKDDTHSMLNTDVLTDSPTMVALDIPADTTQQAYVLIRGGSAPSGTVTITVTSDQGDAVMEVDLTGHPSLPSSPVLYHMFYHGRIADSYDEWSENTKTTSQLTWEVADLADHGVMGFGRRWDHTLAYYDEHTAAYDAAGFDDRNIHFSYEIRTVGNDDIPTFLARCDAEVAAIEAKGHVYDEYWWYSIDEAKGQEFPDQIPVWDAVKAHNPKYRIAAAIAPGDEHFAVGNVDYPAINGRHSEDQHMPLANLDMYPPDTMLGVYSYPQTGVELAWFYRHNYGPFLYLQGVERTHVFAYQKRVITPSYDMYSDYYAAETYRGHYMAMQLTEDKNAPTLQWEAFREATIDVRWYALLEQVIGKTAARDMMKPLYDTFHCDLDALRKVMIDAIEEATVYEVLDSGPGIITHPVDTAVDGSATVTFSAVSGTPAWEWLPSGESVWQSATGLSDATGEDTFTLTINSYDAADAGRLRGRVTGDDGLSNITREVLLTKFLPAVAFTIETDPSDTSFIGADLTHGTAPFGDLVPDEVVGLEGNPLKRVRIAKAGVSGNVRMVNVAIAGTVTLTWEGGSIAGVWDGSRQYDLPVGQLLTDLGAYLVANENNTVNITLEHNP